MPDLAAERIDYSGEELLESQVPADPYALFDRWLAAAFQAMYENLPLRLAQLPSRSHIRLHRRLPYGTLADFTMLDTRQYRSNQPCEVNSSSTCDERFDADQTMLGGKQKRWLLNGFSASTARWQVLGNQAPMAQPGLRHIWCRGQSAGTFL